MNCQNHPERPATAYCRNCGKPVCDECRRDSYGTVFCAEHVPAPAPGATAAPPPGAVPPLPVPQGYGNSNVNPALAFFLGFIPGVGAIYNGQYAKGLVHAFVWGILMSLANSRAARGAEPLFVMVVIFWWFYMVFEAYHTARKRQAGEPVDEYSSIINVRGQKHHASLFGIGLILMGVLMLLHTLDILDFEYVARYWPVLLIAAGAYMLYSRVGGGPRPAL